MLGESTPLKKKRLYTYELQSVFFLRQIIRRTNGTKKIMYPVENGVEKECFSEAGRWGQKRAGREREKNVKKLEMPWKIAGECHKRVALITLLICKSLLPGLEDRLLLYCALRPILFSFRVSQTKVTCIYDVWKCFEMKMLIGYGKSEGRNKK